MDLEDLKKKKISDLRYIGKMLGIKSMTKMTKQELMEAILDNERQNAAAEAAKPETEEPEPGRTRNSGTRNSGNCRGKEVGNGTGTHGDRKNQAEQKKRKFQETEEKRQFIES